MLVGKGGSYGLCCAVVRCCYCMCCDFGGACDGQGASYGVWARAYGSVRIGGGRRGLEVGTGVRTKIVVDRRRNMDVGTGVRTQIVVDRRRNVDVGAGVRTACDNRGRYIVGIYFLVVASGGDAVVGVSAR